MSSIPRTVKEATGWCLAGHGRDLPLFIQTPRRAEESDREQLVARASLHPRLQQQMLLLFAGMCRPLESTIFVSYSQISKFILVIILSFVRTDLRQLNLEINAEPHSLDFNPKPVNLNTFYTYPFFSRCVLHSRLPKSDVTHLLEVNTHMLSKCYLNE